MKINKEIKLTKQMKAHIEKEPDSDALWLIIESEDNGVAHPLLEDEVEAVRDACDNWLKK